MSLVKDNVLYSLQEDYTAIIPKVPKDSNFAEFVYTQIGQGTWLTNAGYELNGKTSSVGNVSCDRSEVEPKSRKIGAALYNFGLRQGDVVHFVIPNNTEYHMIAIAVWLCRGIVSLADPALTAHVLTKQLDDTKAKMVICYEGSQRTVHDALRDMGKLHDVKVVVLSCAGQEECVPFSGFSSYGDLLENATQLPGPKSKPDFQDDDVAVILWSSGTTGLPKGIQQTYTYLLSNYAKKGKSTLDGTGLMSTCFFHIGGFVMPLRILPSNNTAYFFAGQDLDLDINYTAQILFRTIDKYKPLLLVCGSHHICMLADQDPVGQLDLSSVKLMLPMGTNVPGSMLDVLKKKFPGMAGLLNVYGMTELGGGVSKSVDPGKLGPVAPGVTAKIVDELSGQALGSGEVGEIAVKAPLVMKGYLNRPEENEKFFGQDGFCHTGDLGHYDSDGILYFDGRLKELIKYKNCHIYPLEVEQVIQGHPGVYEVAVFGQPHHLVQELVTAAIVAASGSTVSQEEIIALVSKRLDDTKQLRGGVYFVDELPRNATGKIQRKKLLETITQLNEAK